MWRVRHNKVTVTVTVIGEPLQALWVFGGGRERGLTIKYGDGTGRETGKGWRFVTRPISLR